MVYFLAAKAHKKTGMGQTLYTQNSVYRSVIDQASETLELDLPHLYFDADAESTLNETQYTQPAIVAMSLAIFETVKAQLPEIAGGIGLSLGEYSALAASGYLSVDEALRLVKTRGALMQRASDLKPSKMVAVMNTPVSLIEEACTAGSSEAR
ncbi:ACP S-malonyltransferase [Secundilactobacillus odoratitofui]|uniref:ACP S-malonyltransferase n=1 Tax=Secundilactobacillus odoratitofui TaxID=480930 RepID=UPI000B26DF5D|nr:acyltransferase domain-containing protein [Secundilactobacillus odoratitofui]